MCPAVAEGDEAVACARLATSPDRKWHSGASVPLESWADLAVARGERASAKGRLMLFRTRRPHVEPTPQPWLRALCGDNVCTNPRWGFSLFMCAPECMCISHACGSTRVCRCMCMRKLETEARLSSSVALHLVYRHTVPHLNPKIMDLTSLAGQLARLLCVKMTGELRACLAFTQIWASTRGSPHVGGETFTHPPAHLRESK